MPRRAPLLTRTACCVAVITLSAAAFPLHAKDDGNGSLRIPICSSGSVRFITIELGEPESPAPEKEKLACHGPCICGRKKPYAVVKL